MEIKRAFRRCSARLLDKFQALGREVLSAQHVLLVAALASTMAAPGVSAQVGAVVPYQEFSKVVNSAEMVSALDGSLFGDSTSLYNGATEFSITDIELPGNNALPVRLGRRLKIESREYTQSVGGFGIWDIDIPHMYGVFDSVYKWNTAGNGASGRCSSFWFPKTHFAAQIGEVFSGTHLYIPGEASQEVLSLLPEHEVPVGAGSVWGTRDGYRFSCLPTMSNGYPGEGFVAIAPNGTRYVFDVGVERMAPSMDGGRAYYVNRTKVLLLPSRIEDIHGNRVEFGYASGRLVSIAASDGRRIDLVYSGDEIIRADSHGRSWHYHYHKPQLEDAFNNIREAMLQRVVLPDGSEWGISYLGSLHSMAYVDTGSVNPGCPEPYGAGGGARLNFTHPSGAIGDFGFGYVRHYRSGVPDSCMALFPGWEDIPNEVGDGSGGNPRTHGVSIPEFFDNYALIEKRIEGAGIEPMTWGFDYGVEPQARIYGGAPIPCMTCQMEKIVSVTQPDGRIEQSIYGMLYHYNDGRLLGTATRDASGVLLKSQRLTYVSDSESQSMPFPDYYGGTSIAGTDPSSLLNRPVAERVTMQDGATFSWKASAFDLFARPLAVEKWSDLDGAQVRREVTTYHDNLSKWILGQVSSLSINGTVASEITYDSNAQPVTNRRFGRLQQTLTYDNAATIPSGQRGTIASVADGNGNLTHLSNWKRGTPQQVRFPATADSPAGAVRAALVSDQGLITRVTDENGEQTHYEYDALGRLSRIIQPQNDSTNWHDTVLSFEKGNQSIHGVPAGHWQHVAATGGARKVTYLDALWRPVLTHEYDNADPSGTERFTRKSYDSNGRIEFQSYASESPAASSGVWTAYDALGRVVSYGRDSELGLLTTTTDYLPGFKSRTTSPKGEQTSTSYSAWDEPSVDYPTHIRHPEGVVTEISRNFLGATTSIIRRNSNNTMSVERRYVYDQHQNLCKSVEPESGATVMAYDDAGNLSWSASGTPFTSAAACNLGDVPAADRVVRSYDGRNRVTFTSFPGGLGSTSFSYTPDGAIAYMSTDNGDLGLVETAYTYNRRRLLVGEAMSVGAHQWGLGYGYDRNGFMARVTTISGAMLEFAPNALGQPTQAGLYASGADYFPDGSLKRYTFGNGIVRAVSKNSRGLPDRIHDAALGVSFLDEGFDYDQHGNVAAISDGLQGNRGDRNMVYDGLDRLVGTTSPMFGVASYAYDAIDNLTAVSLSAGVKARTNLYGYDVNNRLFRVTNASGGTVASLEYDVRGNLSSKNGRHFDFDHGNRLRSALGEESYAYDGHGRRVQSKGSSGSLYSLYGQDGVLRMRRDERSGKTIEYIYLAGQLVAESERPIALSTPTLVGPGFSDDGQYEVSWTQSALASRYELQERAGAAEWDAVFSGSATSFSASGRAAGEWSYRVRACSPTACGAWSWIEMVVVRSVPTDVPLLSAPSMAFNGTFAVTWQSIRGATWFELRERPEGGQWNVIHDSPALSSEVAGRAGGQWHYQVRACNQVGCGAWSAQASVQVIHAPAGVPVISAPASNMTGDFTVEWAPVSGAEHYELEERFANGAWSLIHNAVGTGAIRTGKITGDWSYRIRACNSAGCTGLSPISTVVVLRPPVNAPTVASPSSSTTGAFSISWGSVAHAASFILQERNPAGQWADVVNGATTAFQAVGRSTGEWKYRVRACNAAGCSGYSPEVAVAVTLPPAQAPSIHSPASSGTGNYTVSWSAVSEASRYELESRSGGDWSLRQDGISMSFEILGQAPGSYDYRVRACNPVGCAAWSQVVTTAVVPPPLAAPAELTIAPSSVELYGAYQLSWPAVAGATHYEVQEQTYPSGGWQILDGNLAWTWYGIFAGQSGTFTYRVRACNAYGCGEFSRLRNAEVTPPYCSYPPCLEW